MGPRPGALRPAAAIIRGAGSVEDELARQRLLAGIAHTLTSDPLGAIPGLIDRSAAELVDELERIRREERDG
jgi:hypothetical protein